MADAMTMNVQLPAPIGTVDYYMFKVSEDAFDETFGLIFDAVRDARDLGE